MEPLQPRCTLHRTEYPEHPHCEPVWYCISEGMHLGGGMTCRNQCALNTNTVDLGCGWCGCLSHFFCFLEYELPEDP